MKGEITIKFNGIDDITVAVKTTRLHKLEKLILIDSLCESLRLEDSEERFVIGATIAVGGMKAVSGETAKILEFDMNALKDALRKDKNNNETDAH
jgi:hypothetical protein